MPDSEPPINWFCSIRFGPDPSRFFGFFFRDEFADDVAICFVGRLGQALAEQLQVLVMDEFFHGYLQARAKTLNRRGAPELNGEMGNLTSGIFRCRSGPR